MRIPMLPLGLVLTACTLSAAPALIEARPGKPFTLGVGEGASSREPAWQLRFEAVVQDSRCPKDVHCVWAGDAIVRLSLQRPAAAPERIELRLSEGLNPGPGLRLVGLEPLPVASRATAPQDYRATLIDSTAAPADPTQ